MSNMPYISVKGLPSWVTGQFTIESLRKKMDAYVQYKHPNNPKIPILGSRIIEAYQDQGYSFGIRPDFIMGMIWAANGLFRYTDPATGKDERPFCGVSRENSYTKYNPLNLSCGITTLHPKSWTDGVLLLNARIESFFNLRGTFDHPNGGYDPCYRKGDDHVIITRKWGRQADDLYGVSARLLGIDINDKIVGAFVDKVLWYAEQIHMTPVNTAEPPTPPVVEPPTVTPPNPPPSVGTGNGDDVLPPWIDQPVQLVKENWWVIPAVLGAYFIISPALAKMNVNNAQQNSIKPPEN